MYTLTIYLRLPIVCKIIAFSGIIAGGIFFCLRTDFAIFLMLHMFAGFETAKKPDETAKKNQEPPNVETETAKKIGNSENLDNRR